MFITILYLLIFCGHSSSIVSVKWADDGLNPRDNQYEGMVPKGRYPYMAYIIGDDALGCSGTIISLRATLTAASCIIGDKSMRIWAGTNRLLLREDFKPPTQYRAVSEISVYSYDAFELEKHDIGIAWVNVSWARSSYVRPIPFWIQTTLLNFEYLQPATVLGWGFGGMNVTDKVLRSHVVNVGSSVMCPRTDLQLRRNLMCNDGGLYEGVCKGDQGGPVVAFFPVVGKVVMGVVRSKVPSGQAEEPPEVAMDPTCTVPTVPSVYTFVGFYRNWIISLFPDKELRDSWKPYSRRKAKNKRQNQRWKQELSHEVYESPSSTGAMALMSQHLLLATLCLLLLPTEKCGCQSQPAM